MGGRRRSIATFFLDSIDELKMTGGKFDLALKRLSVALHGQLHRVRVITTTRPIPFDRAAIEKHLPFVNSEGIVTDDAAFVRRAMRRKVQPEKQDEAPVWRQVSLVPLSDDQIKIFAELSGVADPEALLRDIQRRNAQSFARRPQDLMEICSHWNSQERIGSHREQVAHDIRIKLKPSALRPEQEQLAPAKALSGAMRLAIAALLARKLTIRHNIEADIERDTVPALDPDVILADWTLAERETLLGRGLFGHASYGRVRFHHRTVIEFLAAEYIAELIKRGASVKAIKRILFATTVYGHSIVRPSLRPVAAWLALVNDSVFNETCATEPEVLLMHGDPASLTIAQRKRVLQRVVECFGAGTSRGQDFSEVQVNRFADAELGPEILRLWEAGIENPEVRELWLELMRAGSVSDCADAAHASAIDAAGRVHERIRAVEALQRLNDPRLAQIVASLLNDRDAWPAEVAHAVVVRLFPSWIDVGTLGQILTQVGDSKREIGGLSWHLPRIIERELFDAGSLERMRSILTRLITEEVFWPDAWHAPLGKRPHLVEALAAVCGKLLDVAPESAELPQSVVIALSFESQFDGSADFRDRLRTRFVRCPSAFRSAVFWADVRLMDKYHPGRESWMRLRDASERGSVRLNAERDGPWILTSLSDQSLSLTDRELLLYVAMRYLSSGGGDRFVHFESLRGAVQDAPKLVALLDVHLAPVERTAEQRERDEEIAQRNAEEAASEAATEESWLAIKREVIENPSLAFSSSRVNATVERIWHVLSDSETSSTSQRWSWQLVEGHFNRGVADRLRVALREVWRTDRPSLRSERKPSERNAFLLR